jgi:hypothetical protein
MWRFDVAMARGTQGMIGPIVGVKQDHIPGVWRRGCIEDHPRFSCHEYLGPGRICGDGRPIEVRNSGCDERLDHDKQSTVQPMLGSRLLTLLEMNLAMAS